MNSLKRRRESPASSTEPSPLLPFAANNNNLNIDLNHSTNIQSSSVSAPVPRRASAPVSGQISTDPNFAPYPNIWRGEYSPIYPPSNAFKRQRIMVPTSPFPSTTGQEYITYTTSSYDHSGISSLPTPTPTLTGPTTGYNTAYSTSPMPPVTMSGYPTPSTSYAQTPGNYQTQVSPVSPVYGQTAYYSTGATLGMSFDNPPSEQQIARAKRQQQNRDAQKRFREKKKKTQADMEKRLDDLEEQLNESAEEIDHLREENEKLKRLLAMQSQLGQQAAVVAIANGRAVGGSMPRRPTQSS